MKLYHKDIYMPHLLVKEVCDYRGMPLIFTGHAIDQALSDIYGSFKMPDYFYAYDSFVIEIEVSEEEEITKTLVRIPHPYDSTLDISMVILLPLMIVKTAWQNEINDTHETLCHDKYETEPFVLDRLSERELEFLSEIRGEQFVNPKYDEQAGRDVE